MDQPTAPARAKKRLPPWMRRRLSAHGQRDSLRELLDGLRLNTVCDGAQCPNQCECYDAGTATFLILGKECTRRCRFCAIDDAPHHPAPPERDEPQRVAEAAARMDLKHVVITSVTRDDLPDGGAEHFARTIRAVRQKMPAASIEVLVPDFGGDTAALDVVLDAQPEVFNHNIETVPRLYEQARPQADYQRSLDVLRYVRDQAESRGLGIWTKSGLMLGLGETIPEIRQTVRDLAAVRLDIFTVGQYLAPSAEHLPVQRYLPPVEFVSWAARARHEGIPITHGGVFARSSYNAAQLIANRRRPHSTPTG